jgi:asparagine synthase (glutamine-hydrolysing)
MGICGFAGKDNSQLLNQMIDYLIKPEEDSVFSFENNDVCLGSVKFNSKETKQAHCSSDNKIVVIMEGSIYNTIGLEKGEVDEYPNIDRPNSLIIKLYKKFGLSFVNYLEGDFSIVLYDGIAKRLFFYRDEFGTKPLYYTLKGKKVIFASEVKAIYRHPVIRELDIEALIEQSILTFTINNKTIFKGISLVPPGVIALYDLKTFKFTYCKKLVSKKNNIEYDSNDEEIIKKTEKLLIEAIKTRVSGEKEVGLFLSGGMDSALIADVLSSYGLKVKAYSLRGAGNYDDMEFAKRNAKKYGFIHQIIEIDKKDVLSSLTSTCYCIENVPAPICKGYVLLNKIRLGQRVNLWGNGSEELFKGLQSYIERQNYQTNWIKRLKQQVRIKAKTPGIKRLISHPEEIQVDKFEMNILKYHNQFISHLSSGNAQESRFPFLSQKIWRFMDQVPYDTKIKYNTPKYILKQVAKKRNIYYQNIRKLGFNDSLDVELVNEHITNIFSKIKHKLTNFDLLLKLNFSLADIVYFDIIDRLIIKESNKPGESLESIYKIKF